MTVSMAYALARMHSRMAERPPPSARKRLLAVGDFGHFLQLGARIGFGRWLTRLGPASSGHQVELSLRLRFRELLNELGHWLPARWFSAIELLKLAPDLPALDRLIRGGPIHPWMQRDPLLAPLSDAVGSLDRAALARTLPVFADVEVNSLGRCWLAQALLEVPGAKGSVDGQLRDLLQSQLEGQANGDAARQLELAFRRQPEASVKVVAFTALAQQDFQFLRGQLTRRLLQAGEH